MKKCMVQCPCKLKGRSFCNADAHHAFFRPQSEKAVADHKRWLCSAVHKWNADKGIMASKALVIQA